MRRQLKFGTYASLLVLVILLAAAWAPAAYASPTSELGACGDPATFIHDVQGSGTATPLDGDRVVVEGVVTADFQTYDEFSGFFLQEEAGDVDRDPATSEGIFVYQRNTWFDVNVGDVVRLEGTPAEYYGLTQLKNISVGDITVCSTGVSVAPTEMRLPIKDLGEWEWYEGMLVTFPQTLFVSDNYNLGRYGEIWLSEGGRLEQPTSVRPPGSAAQQLAHKNSLSEILLDDGLSRQNPTPAPFGLTAADTIRAGDSVTGLTGVLHYSYDYYRVQPTQPVAFPELNARPVSPPEVGGNLRVASFNVYNYFTTLGSRGADTQAELDVQQAKIVNALAAIDADVVGLQEIENNGAVALQSLVNALNLQVGAGTYAYIDAGVIGTDEITVALIYKPATVTPTGGYAILDSSVDPLFNSDKNRPALAQTFAENATGELFTVAVNHLKSKGSDCNDLGDPDTGDGQGNCNLTRVNAATALANWLSSDPTGSGDPDFLIIGDLNSYAMEDPIRTLQRSGYVDMVGNFNGPNAYTYVYFGYAGYLDHALANGRMKSQVTGVSIWHINADEPNAYSFEDYNQDALLTAEPWRASDHDPVIIGLALGHGRSSSKP